MLCEQTPSAVQKLYTLVNAPQWSRLAITSTTLPGGVVGKLVFSGGAAHSPYVEAEIMGDLAVKRGVPDVAVLREGRALTTWQNVRFAKQMLDDACSGNAKIDRLAAQLGQCRQRRARHLHDVAQLDLSP